VLVETVTVSVERERERERERDCDCREITAGTDSYCECWERQLP